MIWPLRVRSTIRALFGKRKLDSEMDEEMRSHVEMRTRMNIELGMNPEEARYAALREFGWQESIKESCREARGVRWIENLVQDVRYGLRQLHRNPGFAIVVSLTLALSIGASTVVFSLVDEVLLKMLPVKNPKELTLFNWHDGPKGWGYPVNGTWEEDPVTKGSTCTSFSGFAFKRFCQHNEQFSDIFAFAPLREPIVTFEGETEISARGQLVSGGYFGGLGVQPLLGRMIAPDDDKASAPPVVVISWRFWQRRFGGDPSIIGKTISVNNTAATLIGVTPKNFPGTLDVGDAPDVSLALALASQVSPMNAGAQDQPGRVWWLRIMGRLKPGVTAEQGRSSLEGIFHQTALEDLAAIPTPPQMTRPSESDVPKLGVVPGGQGLTEARHSYARELMTLAGLVGAALLIACINIASLLLVRGAARQREIAVRLAMGAGRSRLVRQLLTESGLLALFGGALGVVLSYWGRDLLMVMHPLLHEDGRALVLNLALDRRVLVFTTALAVLTGLLFGVVPALRAARVNPNTELQSGARTLTGGYRSRLGHVLISAQVALSLVMLVGAGLFGRTLRNLHNVDVGFNREHLLLFHLDAALSGRKNPQFSDFHERISDEIRSIPGVRSVTFSTMPSLSGAGWNSRISVQASGAGSDKRRVSMINAVESKYFSTLEMPIILGRGFSAYDDAHSPRVAVINQAMAKEYFGNENPIGRRFGRGAPESAGDIEIIGVVRDAKYSGVRSPVPSTAYLCFPQEASGEANYAVRTTGNPEALSDSIRRAVRTVDANLPLADVRTQDAQVERLFSQEELFARLSTFFGIFALGLVCIGLYGVMSYSVVRRTSEIGIRMAVGAQKTDVLWLVLRQGLKPACWGIVAGLVAAAELTRLVRSLLFGVETTDPITFAGMALVIVVVALAACWLPAHRAAKVDPMEALRCE